MKIYGECQRNTHSKPESMPILLETVRLSVKNVNEKIQEGYF